MRGLVKRELLQVLYEIEAAEIGSLFPPTLDPAIPPTRSAGLRSRRRRRRPGYPAAVRDAARNRSTARTSASGY